MRVFLSGFFMNLNTVLAHGTFESPRFTNAYLLMAVVKGLPKPTIPLNYGDEAIMAASKTSTDH